MSATVASAALSLTHLTKRRVVVTVGTKDVALALGIHGVVDYRWVGFDFPHPLAVSRADSPRVDAANV